MKILVITTGGTISALPYEDPKNPPKFACMPAKEDDLVRSSLQQEFAAFATLYKTFEPCDSQYIDKAYRQEVLSYALRSAPPAILITHGTDTILDTADFFFEHARDLEASRKKVILTGAMTPLANGKDSDGYLNLTFSLERFTNSWSSLQSVNVVLCDFVTPEVWAPVLYPHRPGKMEKGREGDGRHWRLREKQSKLMK